MIKHTKLVLGHKQAEFLRELLEEEIWEKQQFREDQFGDGGPSGPRAIRNNISFANHQIKLCEELLEKLK